MPRRGAPPLPAVAPGIFCFAPFAAPPVLLRRPRGDPALASLNRACGRSNSGMAPPLPVAGSLTPLRLAVGHRPPNPPRPPACSLRSFVAPLGFRSLRSLRSFGSLPSRCAPSSLSPLAGPLPLYPPLSPARSNVLCSVVCGGRAFLPLLGSLLWAFSPVWSPVARSFGGSLCFLLLLRFLLRSLRLRLAALGALAPGRAPSAPAAGAASVLCAACGLRGRWLARPSCSSSVAARSSARSAAARRSSLPSPRRWVVGLPRPRGLPAGPRPPLSLPSWAGLLAWPRWLALRARAPAPRAPRLGVAPWLAAPPSAGACSACCGPSSPSSSGPAGRSLALAPPSCGSLASPSAWPSVAPCGWLAAAAFSPAPFPLLLAALPPLVARPFRALAATPPSLYTNVSNMGRLCTYLLTNRTQSCTMEG